MRSGGETDRLRKLEERIETLKKAQSPDPKEEEDGEMRDEAEPEPMAVTPRRDNEGGLEDAPSMPRTTRELHTTPKAEDPVNISSPPCAPPTVPPNLELRAHPMLVMHPPVTDGFGGILSMRSQARPAQ